MRDEQLKVGGRPKLVLGVDLKIPSPYKMIMSERGLTNAGNQGVMVPRISREVTFIYVGFCFLQISAQQEVCHIPPRLRQQTTLTPTHSKQRAREFYMDKKIKLKCEFWHKGVLYKSELTCNINLRYLSCQLINVPLMVATSWSKHAAGTAIQVFVIKTGVTCCDGCMEVRWCWWLSGTSIQNVPPMQRLGNQHCVCVCVCVASKNSSKKHGPDSSPSFTQIRP